MARGKHGVAAAGRRANDVLEADLATYQRKVAGQAAEIKRLRDALESVQLEWGKERRTLLEQRRQGVAPELAARDRKILELTDHVQRAERAALRREEQFTSIVHRAIDHFAADHHWSRREGLELVMAWLGMNTAVGISEDQLITLDDSKIGSRKKMGAEAVRRLERAQRRRHRSADEYRIPRADASSDVDAPDEA
jgi:hypothetical protein